MKTKIKINNIQNMISKGISVFAAGDDVEGTLVTFTVISGEGMFYVGHNEGMAIVGKEYSFFFKTSDSAEALFELQQAVETVNYKEVVRETVWSATTNYGRGQTEEFHCKEDAMEFALDCESCVKRTDSYTDVICTKTILNMTQHPATAEQVEAGVVEPDNKAAIQAALTFDTLPSKQEILERAEFLASLASANGGCYTALIGGAPFLMSALESALVEVGITPVYAFSVRESSEQVLADGTVKKVNIFKHGGFVEV